MNMQNSFYFDCYNDGLSYVFPKVNSPFSFEWHARFLKLAKLVSQWSESTNHSNGCLFVGENKRILSLGYTGLPSGEDLDGIDSISEGHFVRAEENAILFSDVPLLKAWSYLSFPVDLVTASSLINVGISGVICPAPDKKEFMGSKNLQDAREMLGEAGVQVYYFDTRHLNYSEEAEKTLRCIKGVPRESQWIWRHLSLAQEVEQWSKDPSTKVGAVIVDKDNAFVSSGYNGFAANVADKAPLYNCREDKYPRVIHAEKNAITFASRRRLDKATLYVTMFPCLNCSSMIANSGIDKIVAIDIENDGSHKWSRFREFLEASGDRLKKRGADILFCNPKTGVTREL